jgi:hypothetical protein
VARTTDVVRFGENFLYVLQGRAPRAARRAARDRARSSGGRAWRTQQKAARRARGEPAAPVAAARLTAAAHGGGRQARTPGNSPHQLDAVVPPRVRERGHPPGAAIVEAEQDHRQGRAVYAGQPLPVKSPGARTRQADLDPDLSSVRSGASRKDGQVWLLPLAFLHRVPSGHRWHT